MSAGQERETNADPQLHEPFNAPAAPSAKRGESPLQPFNVDWALLLKQTEEYAARRIQRLAWRGDTGGVLPDGYDGNSVAAEAIARLFKARRNAPSSIGVEGLRNDLKRRVRRLLTSLRRRKENRLVRNDADLAPVLMEDGEMVSVMETIPSPEPTAVDVLIEKEKAAELDQMKAEVNRWLGQDQLLKDLFACLCAGIVKRADIARRLGLSVNAVKNAKARFARRLAEFRRRK